MLNKTHFLKLILVLVCIVPVLSCTPGGGNKGSQTRQLPKSGVIHEKINGLAVKEISYTLYLPSELNTGNSAPAGAAKTANESDENKTGSSYPVIIAFDPQGSGLLPVTMYKDLAEKYGYILIGSNDSRNGQDGVVTRGIIAGLITEAREIYPIDTNQVYMAGFSGGSRVASMAAMLHREVKGVIGCGAGFPGGIPPATHKFDYFGVAGTADFNMNEMFQLDRMLDNQGIHHIIITFPGPHAWPPCDVMEEGFQWFTLNAMKDKVMRRDDATITRVMSGFEKRISLAEQEKKFIESADVCRVAIQFADGLTSTDKFRKKLQAIQQLPEFTKQEAYHVQLLKKEEEEQQLLMNAIFSKDQAWWKKQLGQMDKRHPGNFNPEDTLMNARLKAFLSLVCYSNATEAIKQRNREAANMVITVYEMADPQNPEPNYMRAVILLQRWDSAGAVKQLETAVDKGFSDKIRMIQQPEFQVLKNSPAWFDLLQKMK